MIHKNAKIALTIPSGRPLVTSVIKSFLQNAQKFGYSLNQFNIYLSIDTQYNNSKEEDFILPQEISSKVNKVIYIFEKDRKNFAQMIINTMGINPQMAETLFVGRGYSKQRNVAIIQASMDNNDYAISFDDDEAPHIPVIDENKKMEWKELDFFTPHLNALSSGADITRGPCLGYLSPIPSDFDNCVPEKIRIQLGEALEPGSDVITKDSFKNIMNKLQYLPIDEIDSPSRPFTVAYSKHGKHIFAGNMGINLQSFREGKIPIFYTPEDARGEDTIFALQLQNVRVDEVPAYIFHDAFCMYPDIFEEKMPNKLEAVKMTPETIKRFSNALIGWLKYAPILIYMTSKDPKSYQQRTQKMIEGIEEPTSELSILLNSPELKKSLDVLQIYNKKVEYDFAELMNIQSIWKEIMVPLLNKNIAIMS